MEIKKVQGAFNWVLLLSETSHIFCCVLPSTFSIISVMVGMGLIGVVPVWMESFHDVMHQWEVPLMMLSGAIVVMGWILHNVSQRMDCHDTGCVHGPCEPKKKNSVAILKIATILFIVNVMIYMVFHRGAEVFAFNHDQAAAVHAHHDHDAE